MDIVYEAFAPVNVVFTILMLVVIAYWLMVVIGGLHFQHDIGHGVVGHADVGHGGEVHVPHLGHDVQIHAGDVHAGRMGVTTSTPVRMTVTMPTPIPADGGPARWRSSTSARCPCR